MSTLLTDTVIDAAVGGLIGLLIGVAAVLVRSMKAKTKKNKTE